MKANFRENGQTVRSRSKEIGPRERAELAT